MNEWLQEITHDPFAEFAMIFLMAALAGVIGRFLKQPLLIMFIVTGIVAGPSVLGIITSADKLQLLAELGISVLLFIVGLKLDLRIIQYIGKVALLTGLGQVFFTSIAGYGIGLWLGFSSLHSLYIGIALTFSSTIIIVKLLTDKKEIDTLHGQIAIGFLIVQDIVVILMMTFLSALGKEGGTPLWVDLGLTMGSGLLFAGTIFVLMKGMLGPLIHKIAGSAELLLLFSIAWALSLAAASHMIGFSGEVGAFIAGVSLASTPYRETISSRLTGVRDFLLLFFFINLGANLNLTTLNDQVPSAIVFSLFVLIGNPLIVLIIMGVMGYRKRTSFLAGLTVAQISEFSLLFAAMGFQAGHITEDTVGLITLVGLITIGLSTYLILYSHTIFRWLSPALSIFEKKHVPDDQNLEAVQLKSQPYAIIFGFGRLGKAIAENLNKQGKKYMAIDFDPLLVQQMQKEKMPVEYGDLEDPDILERIPYQETSYMFNTITDMDLALRFAQDLQNNAYQGTVYLTARYKEEAQYLRKKTKAQVVIPLELAGQHMI